MLNILPPDILTLPIRFLDLEDLLHCSMTCHMMHLFIMGCDEAWDWLHNEKFGGLAALDPLDTTPMRASFHVKFVAAREIQRQKYELERDRLVMRLHVRKNCMENLSSVPV